MDIQPTSAEVIERFQNGRPSVTENKLGKGTAVILGTVRLSWKLTVEDGCNLRNRVAGINFIKLIHEINNQPAAWQTDNLIVVAKLPRNNKMEFAEKLLDAALKSNK